MASVSSSNNFRHADNPAVIPVTGQRISGTINYMTLTFDSF